MPEIDHLEEKLSSVAQFFHSSAELTSALEQITKAETLNVCSYPKYFEIE